KSGQAAKTAQVRAASAYQVARARAVAARAPASDSKARPGATQTQWWSQLIGETSSAVSAQPVSPANARPRRCRTTAAARPARPATAATASQGHCAHATEPASLVSAPRSDWLGWPPTKPVRPAWAKAPPSHQVNEADGNAAQPMSTVAANAPAATAACRGRLVSRR